MILVVSRSWYQNSCLVPNIGTKWLLRVDMDQHRLHKLAARHWHPYIPSNQNTKNIAQFTKLEKLTKRLVAKGFIGMLHAVSRLSP